MYFRLLKTSAFENFSALAILQFSSYIFPLLTVPYLYKVLGVELYGRICFATAFCLYFQIFADYGFYLSAVKDIAASIGSKFKEKYYFNSVIQSKLLLGGICFIVFNIIIHSVSIFKNDLLLYYLSFLIVCADIISPVWYYQGVEKMKYITIINVVTKTIGLIPIFLFVKDSSDYLLVPIFYSIGPILSSIIALFYIRYCFKIRFYIVKKKQLIRALKNSSPYFLSRLSASLFTSTNTFVIGLISGDVAVGIYAAADKLYQAYSSLLSPILDALFPFMVKRRDLKIFKKVLLSVIILAIIMFFVLSFSSSLILAVFYNIYEPQSQVIFIILLCVTIISFPSRVMGYPLLATYGYIKEVNFSVVLGGLFHICCLLIIISFGMFNLEMVAFSVLFSEFIILLYRFYYGRKIVELYSSK